MSCAIYSLRCRRPPSIDWVLRASAQIHRISCSIKYVKYAHIARYTLDTLNIFQFLKCRHSIFPRLCSIHANLLFRGKFSFGLICGFHHIDIICHHTLFYWHYSLKNMVGIYAVAVKMNGKKCNS